MRAPAHAAGKFCGRVRADVDCAGRDALRGLDGLVAPAAVGVEPLVVVGDLVERPFRAFARNARAVRANRDRLERRDVACAQRRVEVPLHPDGCALRPYRQGHRALDRAAARLCDVDDELGLERTRARAVRQVDRKIGVTLGVRLNLVGELVFDGREIVVGEAADIARVAGKRPALDRLQTNCARHVEPARRRPIEEPRVERKLYRLAGIDDRFHRAQGEIEALGNIVLEQELDPTDTRALRIGVGLDRPFPRPPSLAAAVSRTRARRVPRRGAPRAYIRPRPAA